MNLGATLGFWLARRWGRKCLSWFSRDEDLEGAASMAQHYGPALLALARGVPVLAEASVLWMGMHGLTWRAFLTPVLISNFLLALLYCSLGEVAERYHWLPIALAASVALPLALAAAAQRWLPRNVHKP